MRFGWEHPSNEANRTRAVVRAAAYQDWGRVLHRRTLGRLDNNSIIWVDLHHTSKIVYASLPDHHEMFAWRNNLRPGDLFVDVRTNLGSQPRNIGRRTRRGSHSIGTRPTTRSLYLKRTSHLMASRSRRFAAWLTLYRAPPVHRCRDCMNRVDPDVVAEVEVLMIDPIVGSQACPYRSAFRS